MVNVATALNTTWMWKCQSELRRFRKATARVEQTQAAVLQDIVFRNRSSIFGVECQFDKIRTPEDFQQNVPIANYETYADQIERIAAGEPNVLTSEPVRLLEPTSGTSRGEKLIPYTDGLRRQFQRGIATWIGDLFYHRPNVRRGRAYWSISPAFGRARTSAGGIPIGFDDDTAYLGSWEQRLVERLLAVPTAIAKSPDIETFQYQTLLHLVAASDLALISVWSPTFLTTLMRLLDEWHERLTCDLRRGSDALPPSARRADELRAIFATDLALPDKLALIWPRLALVSCWADATAASMMPEARSLMPNVEFQPKGLLSTEAFVTVPLFCASGAALAIRSHFFEFEELNLSATAAVGQGQFRLAHQLEDGRRYRVVVSTAGGLYRYQLYDELMVSGYLNQCPLLRFVGRSDLVSDLVGEKLNEPHVRRVLDRVLAQLQLAPVFAMLAPVAGSSPRYRLYLQPSASQCPADAGRLATLLQTGLEENPHYRLACELGQLTTVEIQLLDRSRGSGWTIYERQRIADGQKSGNVKPTALDPWLGWANVFAAAN